MPPRAMLSVRGMKDGPPTGIEHNARADAASNLDYSCDEILLIRHDNMICSAVNERLPLGSGPSGCDDCRAHSFCNLERGNTDTAGCRCDDDEIARDKLGLLNEGAPCSDILHPRSCRLFKRDVPRMFDEVTSGQIGQFSICAPSGYIGWRN